MDAVIERTAVANQPISAGELNARTQTIDGLGGFDAGRMAALPDGRWLSFTGDATQTHAQAWPVYDNAAVVWDCAGQRRVASSHPGGHFFPRWEDGSEFWPLSFYVAGTRAYVLGTRVAPAGDMQWTALGAYGAVVDVPHGCDPAWVRYFPTPSSLTGDAAVQWFGAIATDGTWVYVHGTLDRPDAWHARDGGYVARVPAGQLEVPHRWTFWTGTQWSDRHDLAVSTIPVGGASTNGTSASYTLHQRPNDTWAVTTKRAGDLGNGLGRYLAATPWGPWTWEQQLPDTQVQGLDCYLAGAAPTIPTVSGQLLVQWSRRGSTPYWAEVPQ